MSTGVDRLTEADALRWIAELFEEPSRPLTPDVPRSALAAWDSLGVLTLIAALDETFGIAVMDADIQRFTTVGDILEILRRNGKLAS
jgi:acyl carrier protein